MKKFLIRLMILGIIFSGSLFAAETTGDIFGKWKTIDDKTKKPKSIVEIYEKNGKAYGKILELFREPGEDPDPICDKCNGSRKDQKVKGMLIIWNLVKSGKEWGSGKILDPNNGKEYTAKLWVEGGKLQVRGYIAFLYRTQVWEKVQ